MSSVSPFTTARGPQITRCSAGLLRRTITGPRCRAVDLNEELCLDAARALVLAVRAGRQQ